MRQDNYKLDSRTVEDLRNQIEHLAKGYAPEWNFDPSDPDIGSVLAILFANQMSKNIERFNQMPKRYRTELVNLMEISPLPAHPAEATVLMELASEAEEGVAVQAGSRLLADVGDERLIFETAFPVHLTPAKLRTVFMTSGANGKVIPIYGDLKRKEYIPQEETSGKKEEENDTEEA